MESTLHYFKSNSKNQIKFGFMLVVLFATGFSTSAQTATRIITDYGGYWSSVNETGSSQPNGHHNLLAFTYGGVIYSTGVNNTALATGLGSSTYANVIQTDFRALPVGTIPGNTGASYNLVAGATVDGNAASANLPGVATITTKAALSDGIKGLDLGTAISNLSSSAILNIPVGSFTIAALDDNTPDILVSQLGAATLSDTYVFTTAAGATVGNSVTVSLASNTSFPLLGTAKLDLFSFSTGLPIATALASGVTETNGTRTMKMAAYKLSSFGITAANVGSIAFLKITPGGGNDPAFFAYNGDSFTPRSVWTGAVSNSWNTAGNWLRDITPDATIDAQIPVVSTVYPLLSATTGTSKNLIIAASASVTITGSGVLNIGGSVSNSGTLNTVDGSVGFVGSTAQSIPANTFSTGFIKNLSLTNPAGVTLNSATSLTGVLTVTAGGSLHTGNFLTLKSTASNTAVIAPVSGSVDGTMVIERYIPAKRAFRFLSSPVDGGTIRSNWQENGVDAAGLGTDITGAGGATNGFDVSGSNNPSLFTYLNDNPTTDPNWNAVTSTTISQLAGVPYRILVRGDRLVDQTNNNATATPTTLRATGTIKYGNVPVLNLNPDADGFNLIGNPYQAPVNMYALLNETSTVGLKKTFYTIWDPNVNTRGGYVTVTFDQGNPVNDIVSVHDPASPTNSAASRYLQPGQACFVQTQTAGTPSLVFKESQKTLSLSNVFRSANDSEVQSKIRFTLYTAAALTNGTSPADGFVVVFNAEDSNEANEFDAIKAVNQDEGVGMVNGANTYSFQRMAMPTVTDIIPLSNTQYRTTDYTYRVSVEGLTEVTPYLHDKYTDTTTELANDTVTEVNFTVSTAIAASTDANRFDVIFQATPLGNNEHTFGNAVKVYPNPSATGNFFIALPSQFAGQASVKVVSVLGQEVYSQTMAASGNVLSIEPGHRLAAGVYLVSITTGSGTATKKLIVK